MKTKKMNGVAFIVAVLLVFILIAIVYNHSQMKKKGGKALDSDNLSLVNFKVDNCYVKCKRPEFVTFEEKMKILQSAKEEEITREREIEIARVIANIKAEEERQRLAQEEADRKMKEELERQRLAKLAEQKKKEQSKTQIASRGSEYKGVNQDLGTFNVSWYGIDCNGCSGITASGVSAKNSIYYNGYGIAAADWSVIPPFSIIEVEGYGQYIVLDKGGLIKNRKLDLLTTSEAKSYEYGRKNLNVKVLRWGK